MMPVGDGGRWQQPCPDTQMAGTPLILGEYMRSTAALEVASWSAAASEGHLIEQGTSEKRPIVLRELRVVR